METFTVVGAGPAAYERYLVPVFFRPIAEAMMALAAPGAGQRVLDVACGTGIVARHAAAAGARTTGIDLNPDMLAVARDLEPGLEWLSGDACALPFPDGSFDIAFCQQGLQFMRDPAAALRHLCRVLVPGGTLALALWRDLSRQPGLAAYVDMLDRHAGPDVGDILRAPFSMPAAAPVRETIAAAGFREQRLTIHVFPARFASVTAFFEEEQAASPLAGPVGELPADVRRSMVRDLGAALRDYTDDDGVVFPVETHIYTARV